MLKPDEYFVFFEDRKVGHIFNFDGGNIGFKYDEEWIHSGFEISQSLTFRSLEFRQESNLYFGNLLPEGEVRTSIAAKLGVSVENDFRLLVELGGECAGALTIGTELRKLESKYVKISLENLGNRLEQGETLLSVFQETDDEIRLSLAGAQDKLPVFVKGKEIYLPKGNSPSTHILKPHSMRFKKVPECEFLMSRLAKRLDLEVAETHLIKINNHNACLVSRYDRPTNGNQVRRLHQEDLCQALGVSHKLKYEKGGGPSFSKIYSCIESCSQRLPEDLERSLKWIIFNIIIGNCDGHAKNISLLRNDRGDWSLSPHYDLVPTRIFPRISTQLAMSVGGSFDSGTVTGTHWKRFAKEVKIGERFLLKMVSDMAEATPGLYKEVSQEFSEQLGDSQLIQAIQQVIQKQTRRLLSEIKN